MSHCLVLDVRPLIARLAVRTLRSVRLYLLLEPETGSFIVREHLEQLYQTDSFSIPLNFIVKNAWLFRLSDKTTGYKKPRIVSISLAALLSFDANTTSSE